MKLEKEIEELKEKLDKLTSSQQKLKEQVSDRFKGYLYFSIDF